MDDALNVDTEVASVTFFEDRAEVTRLARVTLPAGRSRVHARGLTLLVDDRSLVCKSADGVDIVFSRVRRVVEDVAEASAAEVQALEETALAAKVRVQKAERALASAKADDDRTATLLSLWAASVAAVPSRAGDATEELERAYTAIDVERTKQLELSSALRTERLLAHEEIARADARLVQARQKKPRYEAFAEIEVDAAQAGPVTIEVVYRTPCALWRPEHLARLVRNDDAHGGEITITTYATVWQMTGENWKDVRCRFSTARPAREASAPLLREDVLTSRKKSDAERKQVVVEAREQAIVTAGARGTKDVDEMPGVDDGGEVQWLTGRSPATIPSDGHPVRVEVAERKVSDVRVDRVCYPELAATTHLRASGTLPGPGPLLAGPVTVGREREIVGTAKTEFVGAGEPFQLGFGVDDGLRVRRRVVEKTHVTALTGTQHVEREVWLYVSNLSNVEKRLSVVERVPVSEVEDVVVEVQRRGLQLDERDGFATFDVTVAPHGTSELTLAYKIEAKSNVVLP